MEEVEYEGLKNDEAENPTVTPAEPPNSSAFYGYNYDDFTSTNNTQPDNSVEHGILSESNSGFVTLISSLVLSIDSFKHDGFGHTILPMLSLILSAVVLLKTEYNSLPIASSIPNEHVDSFKTALGAIEIINLVFLTTSSKYIVLSTGYLAIWISFLCSTNLCAYSLPYVQQIEDALKQYHAKSWVLFYILMLSVTMLLSTLLSCFMMPSEEGMCSSNALFTMLSAIASSAVAGWLLVSNYSIHTVSLGTNNQDDPQKDVLELAAKLFIVLWLFVVAFLTTSSPYFHRESGAVIGNVFFPSWGCLLLSAYFYQNLNEGKHRIQENVYV